MNQLQRTLEALGAAAPRRQLYARGYTVRDIKQGLLDETVEQIGRSWIVLPGVNPTTRTALQAGSVLAGRSALRSYGLWTTARTPITVASKSNRELKPTGEQLLRHWEPFSLDECRWRVTLEDAVAQYIPTVGLADGVATLDSALKNNVLTERDIAQVLQRTPFRCRAALPLLHGSSGSGLESLFRIALIRRGLKVTVQPLIPGGGGRHSDLLVEDWLYIETDGLEHHSNPEQVAEDHERNHLVVEAGGRWHRFNYNDLMTNMDRCVAIVENLLRNPRGASAARSRRT